MNKVAGLNVDKDSIFCCVKKDTLYSIKYKTRRAHEYLNINYEFQIHNYEQVTSF